MSTPEVVFEQRKAMRDAGLDKLRQARHLVSPHAYVLRLVQRAGVDGLSILALKDELLEITRPFLHRSIKPFNLADYVAAFPQHFRVEAPNDKDLTTWCVTATAVTRPDLADVMAALPPLVLPQSMRPRAPS